MPKPAIVTQKVRQAWPAINRPGELDQLGDLGRAGKDELGHVEGASTDQLPEEQHGHQQHPGRAR
jgi:hypothetical protein